MSDNPTSDDHAGLRSVRRVFEELGRDDPMYAALSRNELRGNRWDPDAFFENGRKEIRDVMTWIHERGIEFRRGRALDFGCAVGRLTQALADYFEAVVGVDIADSMVQRARDFNRHGDRVAYVVNTAPDLAVFDSESFDFVYTNKVLQHIPPRHQLDYMSEFVRLLRPGGVAIFQTRNGPLIRPRTLRALLYTLNRRHLRRVARRIRRRPGYEMHFVARESVAAAIEAAGGSIVDVTDVSRGKPGKSLRYCVVRSAAMVRPTGVLP
jgi:2-polyprenyl-3-methyl-5-hydroxy-6-metoxy-1,4-benzoquinol methylase